MEQQEIFDKVARHLLNQGTRSQKSDGACMYRGDNNTMCAVGCLIPDELYDPRMEQKTVTALRVTEALEEAGVITTAEAAQAIGMSTNLPRKVILLSRLQNAHDADAHPQKTWPESVKGRLRSIAKDFKLNPEILEEI